jgi:hypothetical protein
MMDGPTKGFDVVYEPGKKRKNRKLPPLIKNTGGTK